MDIKEIQRFLGKDWLEVEACIKNSLKSDIELLTEVNGTILSNSGKKIRPLLSLLVARACSEGELSQVSYSYAAASELLHNATLLHDDVADDSDKRRGRPTVNSLWGPSVSVLIGDFWLVKAMSAILAHEGGNRVIRIFSKTLSDLAEGEMLQLQKAQSGDTGEDDYLKIIYCKTASLFETAGLAGAISVNASPEMEKAVSSYSRNIGLAFQIRDDIFDYSPRMDVGKPLGVDILEQKITLPLLGAMYRAGEKQAVDIRKKVKDISSYPEYRDDVIAFVMENDGISYAEARLRGFIGKAVGALSVLPDTREKEYLLDLAEYVGKRVV